jgi:nitrogen fixation/metabolism regulation signal transduction histidine kinase
MVEELQNSADRLAKSERESAWREMAKQVAHEIKNPLTPMKLTVQHLQRAWLDKSPHLDQMVERVSQTLIEQIETLSSIATAFSDFAKMPKVENVKLNLANILQTIVNLYSETENIQINYNVTGHKDLFVNADKDQLLSIFSNLIKNAIQSIPIERPGRIEIGVETMADQYIVSIKDNGTGISPEQVEKIFVPNFTTKTGGTGLGLAMVKNMVESMEGAVWFETIEGEGAIFFVKLHRYQQHLHINKSVQNN